MNTTSLAPIPTTTRRDFVEEALRSAILSGQLPLGSQIVESRLAEQFRVSRGPLREAIRTLADEGLLNVRAYTGTYVATVTEEELIEVHTVRLALEVQAFKLCWDKRSDAFRHEMTQRRGKLLEASLSGERIDEIRAELLFHSVPYEFSGNRLLQEIWRQLAQKIQLGFGVYRQTTTACHILKGMHDRYLELALGDDLAACQAEVEHHILSGIDSIRAYFQETREPVPA